MDLGFEFRFISCRSSESSFSINHKMVVIELKIELNNLIILLYKNIWKSMIWCKQQKFPLTAPRDSAQTLKNIWDKLIVRKLAVSKYLCMVNIEKGK